MINDKKNKIKITSLVGIFTYAQHRYTHREYMEVPIFFFNPISVCPLCLGEL